MQENYGIKLIKQGLLALFVALLAGFCLIFSMLGGVSLSPVPVFFEYALPGSMAGWKAVHIGMLMNGIMAIALGSAMGGVRVAGARARRVFIGVTMAVWGNFLFYLFGMFAPNHGLTLGANRLGEASVAGYIAFAPALLGAISLMYAVIVLFQSASEQR
jgi:hypothetical protein